MPRGQGLGLNIGVRAVGNTDGVTPFLASAINRFRDARFLNTEAINQRLDFTAALWQEIALTYAGVLSDNGFHRWKLGATLKAINPYGSAWVDVNDADYSIDDVGDATFTSLDISAGYSSTLNDFEYFGGNQSIGLPKGTGYKLAGDIGIIYERVAFMPPPKDDSGTSLERDITYEFRLGLSITDIGVMQFDQGSSAFMANTLLPGISAVSFDNYFEGFNGFSQLRDSLSNILNIEDISGQYTMTLPTSVNLNYDYNFGNNFYFNAAGQFDITGLIPADYRLKYPTSITLTPRYETGDAGLYMPIYWNFAGDRELGLAVRYGPITLGTPSFGSLLSGERKSGGVFFSINIRKLKANSAKPYCFGSSRTGSALVRTKRTPVYKRKKFLFF